MNTSALTVADLIEQLKAMPQDYPVWVSTNTQSDVVHVVEWHDSVELAIERSELPTDDEDFVDFDSLH